MGTGIHVKVNSIGSMCDITAINEPMGERALVFATREEVKELINTLIEAYANMEIRKEG